MAEESLKISVIIPVYQTEAWLEACVESLLAQGFQDWEAILVDDGSPDGSGALCDTLGLRDSRLKVLHTENGGVSRARNRGMQAARGDYICFLDSDDMLHPDCLARLTKMLDGSAAPLVACALRDMEEPAGEQAHGSPRLVEAGDFLKESLQAHSGILLSACGVLYPAAWGLRFQEDIAYGEDSLFFCRALKRAGRIVYSNEPLYLYRTGREGNTFTSRSLRKEKDSIRVWGQIRRLFGETDPALNSELGRVLCDKRLQAARQAGWEGNKEEKHRLQRAAGRGLKALLKDRRICRKDKLRLSLLCISPVLGAGLWEKVKGERHG